MNKQELAEKLAGDLLKEVSTLNDRVQQAVDNYALKMKVLDMEKPTETPITTVESK